MRRTNRGLLGGIGLALATAASTLGQESYSFSTYVGKSANLNGPCGIAIDSAGDLYVTEAQNNDVRLITPAGVVSTFAGSGQAGFADGQGTAAAFSDPCGLAIDGAGNLYVADSGNGAIREISPAGKVTTLAGNGTANDVDGTGASARFFNPVGVAIDASGNLYVAELANRVRKIAPGAVVTTIASFNPGTGYNTGDFTPVSVAVDPAGNVYVGGDEPPEIMVISPSGSVTPFVGGGHANSSLITDGTGTAVALGGEAWVAYGAGQLFFAADDLIRTVNSGAAVTTLGGQPGQTGSADGTGGQALFDQPAGLAVDGSGDLYIADFENNVIRKGVPTTAASVPFVNTPLASPGNVGLEQSFTVTTAAFGPGPISYQWYLNGAAISGATASTYSVTAAQATDAGSYTVAATNPAGTTTQSGGFVNVYSPPDTQFSVEHTVSGGTSLWAIAAGAGVYVTVGTGGGILVSSDGVNWTHVTSGVTAWLVGLCYGNGQFVAVGDTGTILLSPDGTHWTAAASSGTTQRLNDVLYAAGLYVAVGEGGAIVTSTDGQHWTAESSGVTTWLRGLGYNAGVAPNANGVSLPWVATGQSGVVLQSSDAVHWTQVGVEDNTASGSMPLTSDLEAVVGGTNPSWVAVGDDGVVATATDLPPPAHFPLPAVWLWSAVNVIPNASDIMRGVALANGAYYAFGQNGTLLASSSGLGPFATLNSGTTSNFNGAAAIGNAVFVVGDNETIVESSPLPASRLLNLSTLGTTSPGNLLTAGFSISGTSPKQVLIRAAGPALSEFGVPNPLPDPVLTLYTSGQSIVASDTGWSSPGNGAAISAAASQVYAFPFSAGSADSALLLTLNPGVYSANVTSASGATGSSLIEVYDDDAANASPSKLVNISSRAQVTPGQPVTAGFVIGGNAAQELLLRGIGPALANYGISSPLPQPELALNVTTHGENFPEASAGAWSSQGNAAEIAADASLVGAFALPTGSLDAAMVSQPLEPGAYTLQLSSGNGQSGVGLVEIYDLP